MRTARGRYSMDNMARPQLPNRQIGRATVYPTAEPIVVSSGLTTLVKTNGKLNINDYKVREPPNTIHSSLDRRIYYVVKSTPQSNILRLQRKPPPNPLVNPLIKAEDIDSLPSTPLRPASSHEAPQTSNLLESQSRFRFTSGPFTQRKPHINIMNLELAGGDDAQEKKRQLELEEIEMFKVMIERRKQERWQQRQKQRQRFRQKCVELLNRNSRIKFEQDEPNYKLIKQIISQLKLSRNIPQHEDHLRILALQSSGRKIASLNNSPRKSTSSLISTQQLKLRNSPKRQNQKSKKKLDKMIFGLSDGASDKVYKKKIQSYIEFLYKINFANCIYVDLRLSEQNHNEGHSTASTTPTRYKVYIGRGNNSLLIKSLIKRRFWLDIVDKKDEQNINFYWTQSKLKEIHALQQQCTNTQPNQSLLGKQIALRSKKLLPPQQIINRQDNLKLMGKGDSIMVENYLSSVGTKSSIYDKYKATIVTNHIPQNSLIGSKKALFHSLNHYYRNILKVDPFQFIPQTYHVRGPTDDRFKKFMEENKSDKDRVWILKPGENSNRGNGISLVQCRNLAQRMHRRPPNSDPTQPRTFIIQSYINKPFLYNNRKFDIRHYMMITSVNGYLKGFWYQEGYIRTSSYQYDLDDLDNNLIHLTNDAIQKYGQQYGKYEPGNKLSYNEFQRYLDTAHTAKKYSFENDILPKMKQMAADAIKANFLGLDVKRKMCNFQVFGLDFMIDNHFKPWLIEVNFNPCLEISCPLLSRIIPGMIENSLRIGLDPLFPPPSHYPPQRRYQLSDNILQNLRYQLIFDQKTERDILASQHKRVQDLLPEQLEQISDHEEEYEDEGQQVLLQE